MGGNDFMYELIVLSLLMQMPVHGFRIVKIINDIIGPVARVSNARIYPLLGRMTDDGLVVVHEEKTSENGLPMRIYRITEKGRLRFHELMLDVTSHPREYTEFFDVKATVLTLLPGEERLYLIDRYIEFVRTHVYHHLDEFRDYTVHGPMFAGPDLVSGHLAAMAHLRHRWLAELAWARGLYAREEAQSAPDYAAFQAALNNLLLAVRQSPSVNEDEREDLLLAVGDLSSQVQRARPVRPVVEAMLAFLEQHLGSSAATAAAYAAVRRLAEARLN